MIENVEKIFFGKDNLDFWGKINQSIFRSVFTYYVKDKQMEKVKDFLEYCKNKNINDLILETSKSNDELVLKNLKVLNEMPEESRKSAFVSFFIEIEKNIR